MSQCRLKPGALYTTIREKYFGAYLDMASAGGVTGKCIFRRADVADERGMTWLAAGEM